MIGFDRWENAICYPRPPMLIGDNPLHVKRWWSLENSENHWFERHSKHDTQWAYVSVKVVYKQLKVLVKTKIQDMKLC